MNNKIEHSRTEYFSNYGLNIATQYLVNVILMGTKNGIRRYNIILSTGIYVRHH